jgi:hypothetical protein
MSTSEGGITGVMARGRAHPATCAAVAHTTRMLQVLTPQIGT